MKGISSVITVVMLTGIGVALTTMYAPWSQELSKNITANVAENAETATKCRNAALSIQNPYYDENTQTVYYTIKNTGTIRFSELEVLALNVSRLNSSFEYGLTPGDSTSGSYETQRSPTKILASSSDCPGLRARTSDIEIRN